MNTFSSVGTWENLPATVIVGLYQYLTLKDKLRLSAVCKTWRDILLQARPIFWKVLTLDLQPEKTKWKTQLKFHREMCLKFSTFTKNLIVNWCVCEIESATYFFTQLPKVTRKVQALDVRRTKCRRNSRHASCVSSGVAPPEFVEALKICITKCNLLNDLSFGYSCDEHLFDILCNQCFENHASLINLNISCAGNSKIRPISNMSYPNWFFNLHTLTMDNDMVTEKYLIGLSTALRQGTLKMERLNIVVGCKDGSSTSICSCQKEWARFFDQLQSFNYRLTIGLVLIAIDVRLSFQQLERMFHSSIPVDHLLLIHTVEDGTYPMENYEWVLGKLMNLRTLTVQGIEADGQCPHDTTVGDRWIDIASTSQLSKFSIFGIYFDVDRIVHMSEAKRDTNFYFTCSKYDIVKKGTILDFLIPLTSDRRAWKEFERCLNQKKGLWKVVDRMPIQRLLKRKGELVENIVRCVLTTK